MRVSRLGVATIAAFSAAFSGGSSYAGDDFSARLSGFEEVGALPSLSTNSAGTPIIAGPTGAILSHGTGKLRLDLDREFATYKLTYSGLGSAVTQAHIHFGKRHVPGGISVFLCTNLGNGPAGTPPCPAPGVSVSGTLTAASVIGPLPQNVHPGNFAEFANIVKSNTAYANIHTTQFPAGEIRGQIREDEHDDD